MRSGPHLAAQALEISFVFLVFVYVLNMELVVDVCIHSVS